MAFYLVLTAGFGEGHNTAARNVAAALKCVAGDEAQVEVRDLFAECYGWFNEWARLGYLVAINRFPRLWYGVYRAVDNVGNFHRVMSRGFQRLTRRLERVLVEQRPVAVVTTFPVFDYVLDNLEAKGVWVPRRATVVTDSISINRIWTQSRTGRFFVPNLETARVMIKLGVAESRMEVSGFPVQPDFLKLDQVRRPAAGRGCAPHVLYVINSGKTHAVDAVRALLRHPQIRLTVTVGRDERLKRKVIRAIGENHPQVKVLGWTCEMPRLLMEHHVVLSKAGGATTQEAIAAGCPMLVTQVVPGQEEGNYLLLKGHGAASWAGTPAEMESVLAQLFAGDWELWRQMRKAMEGLQHKDAAGRIARWLI